MSKSWAIKAVEDAAMARAMTILGRQGTNIRFCGLDAEQLMKLIDHYIMTTGKDPKDL